MSHNVPYSALNGSLYIAYKLSEEHVEGPLGPRRLFKTLAWSASVPRATKPQRKLAEVHDQANELVNE